MSTNRQPSHPLVATIERCARHDENAFADIGVLEAGWFPATDLLLEESAVLEGALNRQAAKHPQMDMRTRGSYFVGDYSWYVPALAVSAYLAEARVPDLAPENIALRFSTYTWHEGDASGEAERIDVRLLSGRFAALPDDPAADHPDATILSDVGALRDWLRTSLEAHMSSLIECIHARTRLGRHAQWCLVADSCAALFLYRGKAIDAEARGQAEGLTFVKAPDSPMNNPNTDYFTLHYGKHCDTFRARGGCCRYYTVAEEGRKCTTCVLRKPEERDQLILDYMAHKYSQETSA